MNRRRLLFIVVTVSVALGCSLVVAEIVLRLQAGLVRSSESMDPGLIGYDSRLGWKLQPGWEGVHRHHDFTVPYEIAEHGFRGAWPADQERPLVGLVGDSFTFGLGVKDDETFAHRLQLRQPDTGWYAVNLGVPGYATDQETLLLEKTLERVEMDHVILVVCLINDVFDNDRVFPLQASHGKPRFRIDAKNKLTLDNVPVPMREKPRSEMKQNLASLIKGDLDSDESGITGWIGRKEIARRLGICQPSFQPPPGYFDDRFTESLDLFDAIVDRARDATEAAGASFAMALLPGRSLIEDADGYSAGYQQFLLGELTERASNMDVEVIDLATPLRRRFENNPSPLFYPNDGHLTPDGHAVVATALEQSLPPPNAKNGESASADR